MRAPETTGADWTHDALAEDLAGHVWTSNRLTFTNMQLGPAGSPRPDVYTIPTTYSRFLPLAYEVKVSVADFRADVTAGKWQSYLPFAAGVFFAVPAGLIGKGDVPASCGLMTRGPNGWRVVKAPTMRVVENLPLELWQKLLFDGIERAHVYRKLTPPAVEEWRAIKKVSAALGKDIAALFRHREAVADAAGRIRTLMDAKERRDATGAFGVLASHTPTTTSDVTDRDDLWRVRDLAYAVEQVVGVWGELAAAFGVTSRWPDFSGVREVKREIARRDPRQASAAAVDALDRARSYLDRAKKDLVGDDPVTATAGVDS